MLFELSPDTNTVILEQHNSSISHIILIIPKHSFPTLLQMKNTNKEDTRQATLVKVVCEISIGLTVTKASLISKIVRASDSLVTITCRNRIATAENMLELLSLGMEQGDLAVVSVSGEDSKETLNNIITLLAEDISRPISPDVYNKSAA